MPVREGRVFLENPMQVLFRNRLAGVTDIRKASRKLSHELAAEAAQFCIARNQLNVHLSKRDVLLIEPYSPDVDAAVERE